MASISFCVAWIADEHRGHPVIEFLIGEKRSSSIELRVALSSFDIAELERVWLFLGRGMLPSGLYVGFCICWLISFRTLLAVVCISLFSCLYLFTYLSLRLFIWRVLKSNTCMSTTLAPAISLLNIAPVSTRDATSSMAFLSLFASASSKLSVRMYSFMLCCISLATSRESTSLSALKSSSNRLAGGRTVLKDSGIFCLADPERPLVAVFCDGLCLPSTLK
mmetsp:Transcript_14229/g.34802  ORF Transcript_14229/g.34802 Transcript_14229/m.34802 type:complete len:221 (+) Transcript_14229:1125-1787(+)